MSPGIARGCLVCTVLFVLSSFQCPAASSPLETSESVGVGVDVPLEFDIPPQELADALDRYSEVTGVAVLVDRSLAAGRSSAPVRGRYAARQALRLLLSGTGLMASYTRDDAFTLQPAQVGRKPSGRSKAGLDAGSYAQVVQGALERALCRSPLIRPGRYRAAFQLWIGPLGEVQHSRLLGSTGDGRRDAALIEGLRMLKMERAPPSSLPQPITILVRPDSEDAGMDCTKEGG